MDLLVGTPADTGTPASVEVKVADFPAELTPLTHTPQRGEKPAAHQPIPLYFFTRQIERSSRVIDLAARHPRRDLRAIQRLDTLPGYHTISPAISLVRSYPTHSGAA
jgi:hypothetical protein